MDEESKNQPVRQKRLFQIPSPRSAISHFPRLTSTHLSNSTRSHHSTRISSFAGMNHLIAQVSWMDGRMVRWMLTGWLMLGVGTTTMPFVDRGDNTLREMIEKLQLGVTPSVSRAVSRESHTTFISQRQ